VGRLINVGRLPGGTTAPEIRSIAYPNGQTFWQGAALIFTAGQVTEGAANLTTGIVGFAAEAVATKLGFGMANTPTVVTGRNQEVSVFIANRVTVFSSALVNNSSTEIAPVATDIGTSYSLKSYAISGNNEWKVDKTGAVSVKIVDIDTDRNIVFFKVIESALAVP
jgi:hypothetical protein